LSAARRPSAPGSIFEKSFACVPAHPLPVPSGVRIVVVNATVVWR
jgi:hypothetical protein